MNQRCGLNNIKPKHVIEAIDKFFDKPLSIIDNSPCNFYLNVSGNLVMRDVLPGFAYYKSTSTLELFKEKILIIIQIKD